MKGHPEIPQIVFLAWDECSTSWGEYHDSPQIRKVCLYKTVVIKQSPILPSVLNSAGFINTANETDVSYFIVILNNSSANHEEKQGVSQ